MFNLEVKQCCTTKSVKKQHLIKKNKVNSNQPSKLTTEVIHVIGLNKNFISKIIFHLIIQ
jgi:hypothetical protein